MAPEAPSVSLTVKCERVGNKAIVRCSGKLVAGVCGFLYKKVSELIPDSKHIVLDLTGLLWIDSMGFGTLVRIYVGCKAAGCRLELINLGPRVKELLGFTNLLGVFADMGEKGITHF